MANPRRDVAFEVDSANVPHDYAGEPYMTTLMNALSLCFPEGERFFVDSVKNLRHHVTDPALAEQVTGFIGQEAMHGREHRVFNDRVVVADFPAAPKVEARLRKLLVIVRRFLPARAQLAVTCALEHFTAILAEQLLTDERLRSELDPSVRPLWVWHALEESEHKSVAFDVYRAAGGGYLRRVSWMLITTAAFFFVALGLIHPHMMASRRILFRPWRWLRGVRRLWIWPGYVSRLAPAYLAYFRPSFHPSDRDNRALIDGWRDRLFGNGGQLREHVRAA
jgi:predicted metal-dependent hydrolase